VEPHVIADISGVERFWIKEKFFWRKIKMNQYYDNLYYNNGVLTDPTFEVNLIIVIA
jgi:hypothetical protein